MSRKSAKKDPEEEVEADQALLELLGDIQALDHEEEKEEEEEREEEREESSEEERAPRGGKRRRPRAPPKKDERFGDPEKDEQEVSFLRALGPSSLASLKEAPRPRPKKTRPSPAPKAPPPGPKAPESRRERLLRLAALLRTHTSEEAFSEPGALHTLV